MRPPPPARGPRSAHAEIAAPVSDADRTSENGDHKALESMYRSEARGLAAFFGRRLRGDDEPGDYVHEAFARLAHQMSRRPILDPRHYLRRIAHNLLFEWTRRLRTRALYQYAPLVEELEPSIEPEQSHRIEAGEVLKIYTQALNELPEKTRKVFLLHRVEELTYKEIGERLGVSIPTVQYHVARALAHLDAALGQE